MPKRFRFVAFLLVIGAAALFWTSRAGQTESFTVMSFNIGDSDYEFPSASAVAKVVRQAGVPDVLLLQELRGTGRLDKLKYLLGYEYALVMPYKHTDEINLAVLSRYPIVDSARLYFTDSAVGSGAVGGLVRVNGRPVFVASAHLDQIMNKRRDAKGYVKENEERTARMLKHEIMDDNVRARQASELAAWIKRQGCANVVVGGDFNTVPFSKAARIMGRDFDDALWPSCDYFSGTYFKVSSGVLPRVDFIFVSENLRATNGRVVRSSPGDHFPVSAQVCLPSYRSN